MIYSCNVCNQIFKSIKNLDFHKKICIYYNYRILSNNNLSNDNIKIIIILSNIIDSNKDSIAIIDKKNIIDNIFIKLKYYSHNSNISTLLLQLFHLIDINENITYLSYLLLVSKLININIQEITNILNIYNNCLFNLNII